MRLFGSGRIASMMDRMGLKEGEVIQAGLMTKAIERAQKKVEENNFGVSASDGVFDACIELAFRKCPHCAIEFPQRPGVVIGKNCRNKSRQNQGNQKENINRNSGAKGVEEWQVVIGMLKNSKGCVRAPVDFDVFYGVERIVLKDVVFNLWDGILFNRAECKLWRRTTTDFGAMIIDDVNGRQHVSGTFQPFH